MPKHVSPAKSYNKKNFINSLSARPLRILSEYLDPDSGFRKSGVTDTIAIFGSARTLSLETATKNQEMLLKSNKDEVENYAEKLAKVERDLKMARYYEEARILAGLITKYSEKNKKLNGKKYLVCTGGGPGIMEAANRGAYEAKGESVALGISLPMEQHLNEYVTPKLSYEFHYFFTRKFWFAYLSKAVVVFPGGFGTMDELFEMLTLYQTKKLTKAFKVILYGKDFWTKLMNFELLAETGMISPKDLNLYSICDTPEEAMAVLEQHIEEIRNGKDS